MSRADYIIFNDMNAKTSSFRSLAENEIKQLAAQGNWASNWGGVCVAANGFNADKIYRCVFDGDVGIGAGVTLFDVSIISGGDQYRINVINENGGRAILPFPDMTCSDAFISAKYRGDNELTAKLSLMSSDRNAGSANIPQTIIGDGAFIGTGVQIRDSVIGCGNRIESAAQLDRVMTGENVSVSKAARITHSFVGDCAHIACCEIANSYIAPFHSQHHNNSFLIAAMIGGQSNIAAGATIGSNHNSRSNDGEIWARRGFWPGLCVSLKHNSRFASFTMIAKGDYPAELDVKLPFSLITRDEKTASTIIRPAFWFTRNMYATMRCKQKFANRDNRSRRAQCLEHGILAPDTIEEIFEAVRLLENRSPLMMEGGCSDTPVKHADQAVSAYKLMIRLYCAENILPFMIDNGINGINELFNAVNDVSVGGEWLNCGGTVITASALAEIISAVKTGKITAWSDVNAQFDVWTSSTYKIAKVKHALNSIARLEGIQANQLSDNALRQFIQTIPQDCETIVSLTKSSRQKDCADRFRTMVYDTQEEMEAVLGSFENDPVISRTVLDTDALSSAAKKIIK